MDLVGDPVKAIIQRDPKPPQSTDDISKAPRLEQIRERGTLRVGYGKDSLPFAFMNHEARLVGFDIEMAHNLAKVLGVSLEFIQTERKEMAQKLNEGVCDIVMSGIAMTADRAEVMSLSPPYMDNTLAFLVRDHRRNQFTSRKIIDKLDSLKIAVPNVPYYVSFLRRYLSKASIVPINSPREFFKAEEGTFDALVFSAEAGSAWTLIYPQYSVSVPHPEPLKIPMIYLTPLQEPEMAQFVSAWVELKKKDGTIDLFFKRWILGEKASQQEPRWSIIRDVLHWVE